MGYCGFCVELEYLFSEQVDKSKRGERERAHNNIEKKKMSRETLQNPVQVHMRAGK